MKKLILSTLLLALTAVVFAQSSERIRSEDSNIPEIDNLSGLKPEGEDLHSDYSVTGLSDHSTATGSTHTGDEDSKPQNVNKGEMNFEVERSINSTQVYPNPATDFVTVNTEVETGTIRILNLLGQEMGNYIISNKVTTLDIADLKEGIYFISVESGDQKIVKKLKVLY